MSENRKTLRRLFRNGGIRIRRGAIFDEKPPTMGHVRADRVRGMMLGLAIGDSLGRSTEGRLPARRFADHGEVRDYLPGRRATSAHGLPSDDTQLAFWTLEHLNEERGFFPDLLATKFVTSGTVWGMGQTVAKFRKAIRAGIPWTEAGPASAGNGALMRIAPMLIPHVRKPTIELWVDTALSAMLTHNDSASIAACVAFVDILWRLLDAEAAPPDRWWQDRYVNVASQLEDGTRYRPRAGSDKPSGRMWEVTEARLERARNGNTTTVDHCNQWHSGAYLLETIPCVLLVLERYAHDPEEAIVRAVNDTKDNDTVAAIVGAAVGALHGERALPQRWREGLLGRTRDDDDGWVFELLEEMEERWLS